MRTINGYFRQIASFELDASNVETKYQVSSTTRHTYVSSEQ